MTVKTRVAPPYSILFIADSDLGEPLEPSRNHLQWSNAVIRISCLYSDDGETTVTLGPASEVDPRTSAVFDGDIKTPNREIVVYTAHLEIVLAIDVPSVSTRVRIWENHPTEPDEIVIGVG